MANDIKDNEPALNLAIRYLSYQPRTIYQMQEYLKKKGFGEEIVKKIIKILIKKKYLNDKEFAFFFVESKVKYKPESKFAFRYDLKKKGICPLIIDSVLEQYNDRDLAIKSVGMKIKTWQNFDTETFKKKMMNFLRYRGFNYDISILTLNHYIKLKDEILKD
ncbi:MAG: regulatory protein RecX [Deltaproteobacteria bacterium]|nr:regulatory protein RecX [Deltaproteobacteria bacterium]